MNPLLIVSARLCHCGLMRMCRAMNALKVNVLCDCSATWMIKVVLCLAKGGFLPFKMLPFAS